MKLLILLIMLASLSLTSFSQRIFPHWTLYGKDSVVVLTKQQYIDCNQLFVKFKASTDSLDIALKQLSLKEKSISYYALLYDKCDQKSTNYHKQLNTYKTNGELYDKQIKVLKRQVVWKNIIIGVGVGIIALETSFLIIKTL